MINTPHGLVRSLLAPYIDLSVPRQDGPVHAWRPYYSWVKCLGDSPGLGPGNVQRILPPAFRHSLQFELSDHRPFAVSHPNELHPELRTESWNTLIQLVEVFQKLDIRRRAAVVETLMSLGFFQLVACFT